MSSSLASGAASESSLASDSDGEADWEEVAVPSERPPLEITLQTDVKVQNRKGKGESPKFVAASVFGPSNACNRNLGCNVSRKPGSSESHAQRVLRIQCHKVHTLCLLANARIRNGWINDPLLHVCHQLLSLAEI